MSVIPNNVIIPPLEFRTLIGKTAKYVNKNGVVFENKIKAKESNNPKFIFLDSNDPYNQYYQYALTTLEETGKLPEVKQTETVDEDGAGEESVIEEKLPLLAPEPYKFIQVENDQLVYQEDNISEVDLKVIKLVAQFAAVNGDAICKEFEAQILNNAMLTSQFQFLKPMHSMHAIYKKYKDVYEYLWNSKDKITETYGKKLNLETFLNKCFNHAEYIEKQSADISKHEEKKMLDKMLIESIDWQDFEIVETIDFTELDEVAELGLPFQKSDLEYRSLLEREKSLFDELMEAEQVSDVEDGVENGEDEEGEDDDDALPVYAADDQSDSDDEQRTKNKAQTEPVSKAPKGMKIRAAGETRSMKRKNESMNNDELIDPVTKEKLLRCPITNKFIPESKFSTHISTLLRDPKYVEEKKRYESKFKYGTNLSTNQVYENIQKLFNNDSNKKQHL